MHSFRHPASSRCCTMTSGTGSWCPESRYTETHCSTVVIVTLQLSVGFEKKSMYGMGTRDRGSCCDMSRTLDSSPHVVPCWYCEGWREVAVPGPRRRPAPYPPSALVHLATWISTAASPASLRGFHRTLLISFSYQGYLLQPAATKYIQFRR